MLNRFLPGSVVVVAALTLPEFSVGAGDLADATGFDDPREPAVTPQVQRIRLSATPTGSRLAQGLAGVRYAPLLDIKPDPAPPAPLARVSMAPPPGAAAVQQDREVPAPSLPVSIEEAASGLIAPPPVPPMMAGAGEMEDAPSVPDAVRSEPLPAAAMIPEVSPMPPAASPAIAGEAPSLPRIEAVAAALSQTMPVGAPVPLSLAGATAAAPATPVPVGLSLQGETVAPARMAAVPVGPVASPGTRAASPGPASPAPIAAATAIARPAKPALAAPAASKPAIPDAAARLLTRVDGKAAGAVDFRQTPAGLTVRLGSIVEVLADRYDPAQLARIRASVAGEQYLSLAELQAQGVPISYDPVYDEFNVGLTDTRPKAARKVHMDQITAPERGSGATGMDQIGR